MMPVYFTPELEQLLKAYKKRFHEEYPIDWRNYGRPGIKRTIAEIQGYIDSGKPAPPLTEDERNSR